jgi:hypothetical protein
MGRGMLRLTWMRRDRRQRLTKVAAVVMLVGMVGLLFASFAVGGGSKSSTTTTAPTTSTSVVTTTTIDPALLSEPAKELEALAATSRAGRYHVGFEVTGDGLAPDVTAATAEVWRDGDRVRQDTAQTSGSGAQKSQTFSGPTGVVQCLETATEPPSCTQLATSPDAADDLVSGIESLVRTGAPVTARDDTVLGSPARCFEVAAEDRTRAGAGCFPSEGVPVRLVTPHFTVMAVVADTAVEDATFAPPAPVR